MGKYKGRVFFFCNVHIEAEIWALHDVTRSRVQLNCGAWFILLNAHQWYTISETDATTSNYSSPVVTLMDVKRDYMHMRAVAWPYTEYLSSVPCIPRSLTPTCRNLIFQVSLLWILFICWEYFYLALRGRIVTTLYGIFQGLWKAIHSTKENISFWLWFFCCYFTTWCFHKGKFNLCIIFLLRDPSDSIWKVILITSSTVSIRCTHEVSCQF